MKAVSIILIVACAVFVHIIVLVCIAVAVYGTVFFGYYKDINGIYKRQWKDVDYVDTDPAPSSVRPLTLDITDGNVRVSDIWHIYYLSDIIRHASFDMVENYTNCDIKGVIHASPVEFNATPYAGERAPFAILMKVLDTMVVLFRSTLTESDYARDFKFAQTFPDELGNKGVHMGFWETYIKIRPYILDNIKDSKQVFIFGHSMGGSMTNILCADLIINHLDIWKRTYAIASAPPRVFSNELAAYMLPHMENRLKQIVNRSDIIPTIPLNVTDTIGKVFSFSGGSGLYNYKTFRENAVFVDVNVSTILACHFARTYLAGVLGGEAPGDRRI